MTFKTLKPPPRTRVVTRGREPRMWEADAGDCTLKGIWALEGDPGNTPPPHTHTNKNER